VIGSSTIAKLNDNDNDTNTRLAVSGYTVVRSYVRSLVMFMPLH